MVQDMSNVAASLNAESDDNAALPGYITATLHVYGTEYGLEYPVRVMLLACSWLCVCIPCVSNRCQCLIGFKSVPRPNGLRALCGRMLTWMHRHACL